MVCVHIIFFCLWSEFLDHAYTVNVGLFTKVWLWSNFYEISPEKRQILSRFSPVFSKFVSGISLDSECWVLNIKWRYCRIFFAEKLCSFDLLLGHHFPHSYDFHSDWSKSCRTLPTNHRARIALPTPRTRRNPPKSLYRLRTCRIPVSPSPPDIIPHLKQIELIQLVYIVNLLPEFVEHV